MSDDSKKSPVYSADDVRQIVAEARDVASREVMGASLVVTATTLERFAREIQEFTVETNRDWARQGAEMMRNATVEKALEIAQEFRKAGEGAE